MYWITEFSDFEYLWAQRSQASRSGSRLELVKNQWPNSEGARVVRLFAEQMLELVHDFSWDNYRHYTMDALLRLGEARRVCVEVRKEVLPRQALAPIVEELCWSISSDPVILELKDFQSETFIDALKDQNRSVDSLMMLLTNLRNRLVGVYKPACESRILTLMNEPKRKQELLQITKMYCSHLVNVGYEKAYIEEVTRALFFSEDHKKIDTRRVQRFFAHFKEKQFQFTAYCKVNRHFATALKNVAIAKPVSLKDIPPSFVAHDPKYFSLEKHEALVLVEKIADKDIYGARMWIENLFAAGRAIMLSYPSVIDVKWPAEAYIVKGRASTGVIVTPSTPPLSRKKPQQSGAALRGMKTTSRRVFTSFNQPSTQRLLRSLSTGSLSRTSSSTASQLISLWSAVEVLLSEPLRGVPRIVHYADQLVPCLCLRYARTTILRFFDDLSAIYGKKFFDIIVDEPNGHDHHSKFISLMCAQGSEELRIRLVDLCIESPLALHRAYAIHESVRVPRALDRLIQTHEDRVRWQIHRIYRVRNDLVHSGHEPGFLPSVLGNLDEYYRLVVGLVLRRAARHKERVDIDQMVSDISLEYKMYRAFVRKRVKDQHIGRDEVERFLPM